MANNTVGYGFMSLQHLWNERVTTVGTSVVTDAITKTVAEYTRSADEILSMFAKRTTDSKVRYKLPGAGTLQPLDAQGNPLPVADSGYYDVAFPIQGAGTAFGTNRVTRALMTVEEANRFTLEAIRRDADWVRRHALAALLDNATGWTYVDEAVGSLTIQPLANADSVVYVTKGGLAPATDNHYYSQVAAIADATNPFKTVNVELTEHPGNDGEVVIYIATSLRDSTMALAEFIDRPNTVVNIGANSNTLTSDGTQYLGPGDQVLGYLKTSRAWVIE
jgi:hypothetical protein